MSKWQILIDDEPAGQETDWLPLAVATWDRASKDRSASQLGCDVTLLKDDRACAAVRASDCTENLWPDGAAPSVNDLGAALLQLIRHAGVSTPELLDKLHAAGLPTTRAQLDSIKGQKGSGKHRQVTPAELIVICYSAIDAMKERQ